LENLKRGHFEDLTVIGENITMDGTALIVTIWLRTVTRGWIV
jgi:hypothetical protein